MSCSTRRARGSWRTCTRRSEARWCVAVPTSVDCMGTPASVTLAHDCVDSPEQRAMFGYSYVDYMPAACLRVGFNSSALAFGQRVMLPHALLRCSTCASDGHDS